MVITPQLHAVQSYQRVSQVTAATPTRASGADEAYEDERRLLRRWQDRVEISSEAYRLLDAER